MSNGTELRRILWMAHGCPLTYLYGDDGEMQCCNIYKHGAFGIDFKRDSIEIIEQKLSKQPNDTNIAHRLDTDKVVCFYENEFYPLSNFSAFRLLWKGIEFDTSEAAYHWEKFTGYPDIRSDIIRAPSAHLAFKVAEQNKDKVRSDWKDVKVEIMRRILTAKVKQHEYVRRKLLETGNRLLLEDSWRDSFWGDRAKWYRSKHNGKTMDGTTK